MNLTDKMWRHLNILNSIYFCIKYTQYLKKTCIVIIYIIKKINLCGKYIIAVYTFYQILYLFFTKLYKN